MFQPNTAVAAESIQAITNTSLSEAVTTSNDKNTSGDLKINDLWEIPASEWKIRHTLPLKIEFKSEESLDNFLSGHLYDVTNDVITNVGSWIECGTNECKEIEKIMKEIEKNLICSYENELTKKQQKELKKNVQEKALEKLKKEYGDKIDEILKEIRAKDAKDEDAKDAKDEYEDDEEISKYKKKIELIAKNKIEEYFKKEFKKLGKKKKNQ